MMITLQILSSVALTYATSYLFKNYMNWGDLVIIIYRILSPFIFMLLELATTSVKGCMTYVVGFIPVGFFCLLLSLAIYEVLPQKKIPEA